MNKRIFTLIFCLIAIAVVAGFNYWLIAPWFSGEGPADLGSIEVSYVSMSQFLVRYWPHLSWAPFWYFGFPFHVFYLPVLPVLVVAIKVLLGFSFWHAYRIITGLGLVLAPVSLFFFVCYIGKSKLAAFSSALLYSVIPSIFYFILPSGEVRSDQFTTGLYDPRRFVLLARWGEGPHTLSLIFLPLAGLFFIRVLDKRTASNVILAAFFTALVALTNAIGFYALVFLLITTFLVKAFFDSKNSSISLALSVVTAGLSYGLIAFWYNLSFIKTFFGEGGGVFSNWLNLLPWGVILLVGGLIAVLYLLKTLVKDYATSAILLWTGEMFSIVAIYYFSAPPELFQQRIELAPQALRFMTEVDLGLAVLICLLPALFVGKVVSNQKVANLFKSIFFCLIVAGSLVYGFTYGPISQKYMAISLNLGQTSEKKVADFLNNKVDTAKGERVFIAGNDAFYLNYFTDIWQLRGGLYQAKTHPWPEHIYYLERMGKDFEIANAWLKVANAKYMVVDPSNEIEQKDKFAELNLETTLEDGTKIYDVELTNSGPVKIVTLDEIKTLKAPVKADDKDPLLAYTSWLEKIVDQNLNFRKIDNDQYEIKGNIEKGQGVLVQITYDSGFKAVSNTGKVTIGKDPMGFMILTPAKSGDQVISLTHGVTLTIWLGYLVTIITLGVVMLVFLRKIYWRFHQKKTQETK